jgi:septal ring factor EnvC (AmiA/AmiB activator)
VNNNIKFLDSEAFRGLNKLKTVHLKNNVCIDEEFETSARIAVLQQKVNEKCSIEALVAQFNASTTIIRLETQLTAANATNSRLEAEISALKLDLIATNKQNLNLNAEIENLRKQIKAPYFEIFIAVVATLLIVLACSYVYRVKLSKILYGTLNEHQMSTYDDQQHLVFQ